MYIYIMVRSFWLFYCFVIKRPRARFEDCARFCASRTRVRVRPSFINRYQNNQKERIHASFPKGERLVW